MVDRFPIDALNVEGVPVYFVVGDGEVVGFVKFTRSGRPIYRVGNARQSVDLPRHAAPSLWRPVNCATWPDDLPDPAVQTAPVDWASQPTPHGPPDASVPMDRWPYPDLTLGRVGIAPKTAKEAEARVLRAVRAHDAMYADRPSGANGAAWPKDLLIAAAVVRKLLENSRSGLLASFQPSDYADVHVDKSDLRPLPARWMPTPRDISDMVCLKWMDALRAKERELVMWRAAMPSYSFAQIAEFRKLEEEEIRAQWQAICNRLFEVARERN